MDELSQAKLKLVRPKPKSGQKPAHSDGNGSARGVALEVNLTRNGEGIVSLYPKIPDPHLYGTHSLRRTKATLIYRRTGNLRAVQLLLGHTKIESTVRYLGIEVDDALSKRTGLAPTLNGAVAIDPKQLSPERKRLRRPRRKNPPVLHGGF